MAKKKNAPEVFVYRGLIVAHCKLCGNYTSFYTKEEINKFKCRSCGEISQLVAPATPLLSVCECGNRIMGVTNSDEDIFQFNCKCGYPNSVEYSSRKNKYFGMR